MLQDSETDVAVIESMTTTGWPGTASDIIMSSDYILIANTTPLTSLRSTIMWREKNKHQRTDQLHL